MSNADILALSWRDGKFGGRFKAGLRRGAGPIRCTARRWVVLLPALSGSAPVDPAPDKAGIAPGCSRRSIGNNRHSLVAASEWRPPLPAAAPPVEWDRPRRAAASVPELSGFAAPTPGLR